MTCCLFNFFLNKLYNDVSKVFDLDDEEDSPSLIEMIKDDIDCKKSVLSKSHDLKKNMAQREKDRKAKRDRINKLKLKCTTLTKI